MCDRRMQDQRIADARQTDVIQDAGRQKHTGQENVWQDSVQTMIKSMGVAIKFSLKNPEPPPGKRSGCAPEWWPMLKNEPSAFGRITSRLENPIHP